MGHSPKLEKFEDKLPKSSLLQKLHPAQKPEAEETTRNVWFFSGRLDKTGCSLPL